MSYRSIVIPIDLAHPEAAPVMFDRATRLLAPEGRITVVHSVQEIPSYATPEMPEGFLPAAMARAERALRDLIDQAEMEGVEIKVLTGHAPRAILMAAGEVGADLILVASHRPRARLPSHRLPHRPRPVRRGLPAEAGGRLTRHPG